MDVQREFNRIMQEHTEIALASCTDGQLNVRLVNFYYDCVAQKLFFATFPDNDKVREFAQNNQVAFTTVPRMGNEHVKAQGKVQRSSKSIYDIQVGFVERIADYRETIAQVGEMLVVFEMVFSKAIVTLDLENSGEILLK